MSGYFAILSQYAIKEMQSDSTDAAIMRIQTNRCMSVRKYNSDKEVVDASESVALRYGRIPRDFPADTTTQVCLGFALI